MTAFAKDASSWSRLDFGLLRDGGVALYYAERVLIQDIAWLREEGYLIHEFDARRWSLQAAFHEDVVNVLSFPSNYGRNLDAFNDCMRDVEVPPSGGMAMVIRGIDAVHPGDGQFLHVVDILAGIVRTNLIFGRRLLILLQSHNPAIEFPPVGAVPVMWNPREWLNSDRGL